MSNNLKDALVKEANWTKTENGNDALKSTGNSLVDLFGVIGALRTSDKLRIETLFSEAYNEDPLLATKILFYTRDIRGGLGERDTFRTNLKYLAKNHPNTVIANIGLIPFYGRFDDWYELIGTPCEEEMWKVMKCVFETDLKCMKHGNNVSLLAKWIKSSDSSQKETRCLGIKTALKLGYKVPVFKRKVKELRKYINITERALCLKAYEDIIYEQVPSKAMLLYRNAFLKHDGVRFNAYLESLKSGDVKINSSTLFPYDLVRKYRNSNEVDDIVEAQWKALPNYLEDVENSNVLVMCDVSASMSFSKVYPLDTAVSLSIYFAERNKGMFNNYFMSFSTDPQLIKLRGESLCHKYHNAIRDCNFGGNTDLRKAFRLVLDTAVKCNIAKEEIPSAIVVITDMEIDGRSANGCGRSSLNGYNQTFYDGMKAKYTEYGYEIPDIVFWNVESRHNTYHGEYNVPGVKFVSGSSASSFNSMLQCIGYNAYDAMIKTLSDPRYDGIRVVD